MCPQVVLGSRATKRLALENNGDTGTKFKWDARALGPHFSVFPTEGFLAPHQVCACIPVASSVT